MTQVPAEWTGSVPSQAGAQMHSFRTLATNTLLGGAGATLTLAIGLLLKVLLARALSVQDFGVFLSAQAIVGFVVFAGAACIPDAVVWLSSRALAEHRRVGAILSTGAVLVAGIGGLASLALIVLGQIMDQPGQAPGLWTVVALLALTVPLIGVAEVFAAGLRSIGALWPHVVALNLGRPLLALIGAGMLAALGQLTLASMSLTLVAAALVTGAVPIALAFGHAVTRPRLAFEATRARALVQYGLPLLGSGVLAGPIINSGIPALLVLVASASDVAMYSAALALQVLVYMPTGSVEQAILPHWSSKSTLSSDAFQTVTRWSLIAGSTVFAVLWLVPSDVMTMLYGPQYAGAGDIVRIAALAAIFGTSVGPNEAALRAVGATRWIFLSRLLTATLAMAMAAILVADWGALGAVTAFAAGSTALKMLYALRLWQERRVHPVSSEYLRALAAIVAALATTQFVLAYLGGEPAVRVVAAAGIYPCALLGLLVAFRTSEPKLLLTGLRHLSRRLRAAV